MAVTKFVGKDYETVLNEGLESLGLSSKEVIVKSEEIKGGLFKASQVEVTIIPFTDVIDYIKSYLEEILTEMGLEISFETQIREDQIKVKMYSDDNPILIGHAGKNLAALQTLVRASVKSKYGKTPYISLDVENYKDKQLMYLEKTAKRIAKEVSETKIAVELDNMNSYERLVVHNAVSGFEGVYTESVGDEPNRHVVIKPKED